MRRWRRNTFPREVIASSVWSPGLAIFLHGKDAAEVDRTADAAERLRERTHKAGIGMEHFAKECQLLWSDPGILGLPSFVLGSLTDRAEVEQMPSSHCQYGVLPYPMAKVCLMVVELLRNGKQEHVEIRWIVWYHDIDLTL